MAGEEMERTTAFMLEQQAQFTATVVGLLAEKVDRNAESAAALLAIAEIHEDREA